MSADNWTKCPKCQEHVERVHQKKSQIAQASYGKVPADEYLKVVEDLEKLKKLTDEDLREDFEIGIRGGIFSVSYGARCNKCGYAYTYNFSVAV